MLRFLFSFCIVFTLFPLSAQEDKTRVNTQALGIMSYEEINALLPLIEGIGTTSRETLQGQSVKSYIMPVRKVQQQGEEWAYVLSSCLEFYVNLDKNYKVNLSPDYVILNLISRDKNPGFRTAFEWLAEDGTVSAAILPYGSPALTSAVYATYKYNITNYLHIFRDISRPNQRVFETRKALMRGNPVIVEIRADESIEQQTGSRTMQVKEGNVLFPFLVVGYDDLDESFELMGAWGRSWGNGGYVKLNYKDFGDFVENGYVIVPATGYN